MRKILFLLMISLTLASCTDLDSCITGDFVNTYQLDESYCRIDARYDLYIPALGEENAFKIFTNYNDARRQIEGIGVLCSLDGVDFNRYDLLMGQTWVESNNHKINYIYIRNCNGTYDLTVELFQNRTGRPQLITYHTIVPKLYGSIPVVTTQLINP